MNYVSEVIEKVRIFYPKWEKHAQKQVQQHFMQVLLNQLEKNEPLYTIEDYMTHKKETVERIWDGVWKQNALQYFSRDERFAALQDYYKEDAALTKAEQQKQFAALVKDGLHWSVERWLGDFSRQIHIEAVYQDVHRQHKRNTKKARYGQVMADTIASITSMMDHEKELLYKQAREYIALCMLKDINRNARYKLISSSSSRDYGELKQLDTFFMEDYTVFGEFLEEYTGDMEPSGWRWDEMQYTTYSSKYENALVEFLYTYICKYASENMSAASQQELLQLHELFYKDVKPNWSMQQKLSRILPYSEELNEAVSELAVEYIYALGQENMDIILQAAATSEKGTSLQAAYEQKIAAILERRRQEQALMESLIHNEFSFTPTATQTAYILHVGPTNSGKTYHALQRLRRAENGIYMAPLRLLALEVYHTLNEDLVPCHLKTGEEERYTNGAVVTSCTIEVANLDHMYEAAVIDEAQMIADKERGFAWYRAITKTKAREIHIILAPHALHALLHLLDGKNVQVKRYERSVPLTVEQKPFQLKSVKDGDALVVFSRNRVLQTASALEQQGRKASVIYGGMPPETRQAQIADFIAGRTQVVVSTDAIGMGLNLPIQRIVFLETTKFDGTMRRNLTSQEIKQIAGRAGRKGIYDVGFVASAEQIKLVQNALTTEDEPIQFLTIKPTTRMLKEFAKLSQDFIEFLRIWDQYKAPAGMIKADLTQEQELYEDIRSTAIVERLSLADLYRYISMPFSHYEKDLRKQWKRTLVAIVNEQDIPEPELFGKQLEQLEQNYKKIGLHLLFLYSLDLRREAYIWERERQAVSDNIQSYLKHHLKSHTKACSKCNKQLPSNHRFHICDACYQKGKSRFRSNTYYKGR